MVPPWIGWWSSSSKRMLRCRVHVFECIHTDESFALPFLSSSHRALRLQFLNQDTHAHGTFHLPGWTGVSICHLSGPWLCSPIREKELAQHYVFCALSIRARLHFVSNLHDRTSSVGPKSCDFRGAQTRLSPIPRCALIKLT